MRDICEYYLSIYSVNLVFARTPKALARRVRKDVPGTPDCNAQGRMLSWWCDGKFYIGIHASTAKTLAHECVHAKNEVYSFTGMKLDLNNDEAEAYLVGHLFELYCKYLKLNWM